MTTGLAAAGCGLARAAACCDAPAGIAPAAAPGAASTAATSARVSLPVGFKPALISNALMAVAVRRPKSPSTVPSNRFSAASFSCSALTS